MRNRRLLRKWARWLLPLLAARAFLPVGFMLTTQADGLALTFCPDRGAIVQGVDHGAMAHAGHGGHQQHSGHFDPPCPFALAAVAANIDVPQLDIAVVPAAEQFVPKYSVAVPLAGPQRIDRIRGPPSLS